MGKKRVVVTGVGMITPVGNDATSTWSAIMAGQSGVDSVADRVHPELKAKIAACVKGFDVKDHMDLKEARKLDQFIHYAVAASNQAVSDAQLVIDERNADRVGVAVGSGIGGLPFIAQNNQKLIEVGPKRVSPFFIPGAIVNMASGYVSIVHGATGPNFAAVTACTTGAHNIAIAARLIQSGDADVMIAGGCEMTTSDLGLAGFCSVRALSQRNDEPERASRPWDQDRDGFVLGEGAGVMVLESYESAKARRATIYGELKGVGMSSDAYHITSPGGHGAEQAMNTSIRDAGIDISDIAYVNAHATSTLMGDVIEAKSIAKVFARAKELPLVSSTKSMTGHLIGAAGSVEAIICLLALKNQMIPPTINLDQLDPQCDVGLDFVPGKAREARFSSVLSNSFGFGGTNASLIFSTLDT